MKSRPPYWAQRIVEWYCKPQLAEDLLGDLNEYFERNIETKGLRRARLIYIIDAFKFFRPYTIRTPKFVNLFINWIMIGSYIKTSGRNVMRNKLFSAINIVGLAISMSVGLMLIAFLHDLSSYDRFHQHGDRIYRVVSQPTFGKDEWDQLASTSLKTAKLIEEKVPGIEEVAALRNEFSKDAKVGDNVIPVSGFWAEPSLLKIFSFPLIAGDKATCLKEPNSIVLTEQSAKKIFGDGQALGQLIKFDTVEYQVTGVLKEIPFFSHIRFEALASLSTLESQDRDGHLMKWTDPFATYVYLLLPEHADISALRERLNEIARVENATTENASITLDIQPLNDIVLGEGLNNSTGPSMKIETAWVLGILAAIVILSACFNYTNLSLARSFRRFKEIGLRKSIGANRSQVRQQFIYESIIISLAAVVLSFGIYVLLSQALFSMVPEILRLVKMEMDPLLVFYFILFSILVGTIAGFMPALFFSRINVLQALKDGSSIKLFRHINLRRALVVVQYTFTLVFITATIVGYKQYKSFLAFDLGYDTENMINVRLSGNNSDIVMKELGEIPDIVGMSRSRVVSSVGNFWGTRMKYKNMNDSTAVWYNMIDENYLPLHEHQFVAGKNFVARPSKPEEATEAIVNVETLVKFGIGDPKRPDTAIGEQIVADGRKLSIVGVVKDFHYGKVNNTIDPVVFVYWTADNAGFVNLKVQSTDLPATMARIGEAWKRIDKVHPLNARFYSEAIEAAYLEYSLIVKVIGVLSFLAISIASLGLFGMIVFTTETRLKEISIRKVVGASIGSLIMLLSRNFVVLLGISAAIAIPLTYFVFEKMFLPEFPYHTPVGILELVIGLLGVLVIAIGMIGTQTVKAAMSNPAEVLKND